MKVMLTDVRISFPQLFTAKAVNNQGDPRFSACFMFDPKSENAKQMATAIEAVANEKWGAKAKGILGELIAKDRVAYKAYEKKSESGDVYNGFAGTHHVNASNKTRPLCLDKNKAPITAEDGKLYGGCYVNASIELWTQDNEFGKRINATLRGVQFVRDGEAFSGGAAASEDEFADLSTNDLIG